MSDPNRLNDLRRQRALVAEQLAWLDREIAAASDAPPAPPPPAAAPAPAPIVPPRAAPIAAASSVSAADADALLNEYRVAPDAMKSDVKKGCFLYFFAALAFVALGVVALYFLFRHGK